MDILHEVALWFAGPANDVVETATIGVTEESAKLELERCFKQMDTIFMANFSNVSTYSDEIVAEPKVHPSDHKHHFALYSKLMRAKKIAQMCGEISECYKPSLIHSSTSPSSRRRLLEDEHFLTEGEKEAQIL